MKRLLILVAFSLSFVGCVCTDPQYRCSQIGIVETRNYTILGTANWKPLEGGRLIKCTPGQPVTAADIVKQ